MSQWADLGPTTIRRFSSSVSSLTKNHRQKDFNFFSKIWEKKSFINYKKLNLLLRQLIVYNFSNRKCLVFVELLIVKRNQLKLFSGNKKMWNKKWNKNFQQKVKQIVNLGKWMFKEVGKKKISRRIQIQM